MGYQGKEIETTLQAPDEPTLKRMIAGLQGYADKMGLEPVEVLMAGPDPDGGFKAVVVAHNFNPITWLKGKKASWDEGYEAREKRRVENLEARAKRTTLEAEYRAKRAAAETKRAQASEGLATARASEREARARARRAAAHARAESSAAYRERIAGAAATAQQIVGLRAGDVGATIIAPAPKPQPRPRRSIAVDVFDATLP